MNYPRVLVVEDHILIQRAIQSLLSDECTLVGIHANAHHLSQLIIELTPDVLVLDVSLPGVSGLQVLPELRRKFSFLGIVVITNHDHPIYRTEAFKRGADAFVLKDNLLGELCSAVLAANSSRRLQGRAVGER